MKTLLAWFANKFNSRHISKKYIEEEIEMPGTTLCVVDMQPKYPAALTIMKEVIREIELAKQRGDGIVFIELKPDDNGKTHQSLLDVAHADKYSKIAYTTKTGGDGSNEFIDAAAEWFPLKRIRICGVNRDACVMDTVRGLVALVSKKVKLELAFSATAPGKRKWSDCDGKRWEDAIYQKWIDEDVLTLR